MKKYLIFLPLLLIGLFTVLLINSVINHSNPRELNKPLPPFNKISVENSQQYLTAQSMPKDWYLLNIWASWCGYCKKELPVLNEISQTGIAIVGLNYRDTQKEAVRFLEQNTNPFVINIYDPNGEIANQLGVDVTPETYLVDAKGMIRLGYTGELTLDVWNKYFLPIIKQKKD